MVEEQGSVTVWDAIDRKGNGFEGSEVGKMHNYMLRVEKFTLRPGKRQESEQITVTLMMTQTCYLMTDSRNSPFLRFIWELINALKMYKGWHIEQVTLIAIYVPLKRCPFADFGDDSMHWQSTRTPEGENYEEEAKAPHCSSLGLTPPLTLANYSAGDRQCLHGTRI